MRLGADIRYALRSVLRRPVHSAIIVITLALGIGITAAVFNLVDSVLLQPLPFPEPERLVMLTETAGESPPDHDAVSSAAFLFWRDHTRAFEAVAAYDSYSPNLTGIDRPQTVQAVAVSPHIFDLLGRSPQLGRGFSQEDGRPGAERVAVISYGLWQSVWGGRREVLEKTIALDGEQYSVVGVMPADFRFMLPGISLERQPALWTPISWSAEDAANRNYYFLNVIARLKPQVELEQAQEDLRSAFLRFDETVPDPVADARRQAHVLEAKEQLLDIENLDATFAVAVTAALCVLLIACTNVVSLLLSRAVKRRKEIAIRRALGAAKSGIAAPFLSESLLLAFLSGLLGLLLVRWCVQFLLSISPMRIPRGDEIGLDWSVALFVMGLSLAVGLVNGAIALSSGASSDLRSQLADGSRRGGGEGGVAGRRLRAGLVAAQIALAVLLSIGAALLTQSFFALRLTDPGFLSEHVVTALILLPSDRYPPPQRGTPFFSRLLERLRQRPGVVAAGASNAPPLSGIKRGTSLELEGEYRGEEEPWAAYRVSSPGFFKAMGIPLIGGRALLESDEEESEPVAVISRSMAQAYWPNGDPLGKRVKIRAAGDQWHRIVGVVGDTLHRGLNAGPTPEVYVSYRQRKTTFLGIAVRSQSDPQQMAEALRSEVLAIDPDQPIYSIESMSEIVSQSVAAPRFRTLLMGSFSLLALFLALLGIYGILSYSVASRTHEMGVRMALGADGRRLRRLVVGQGMRTALAGVVVGLVAAALLANLLASLLYQVGAHDLRTFLLVPSALLLAAFVACYIPARRATRVDPLRALRD
ncbi:MAG TPA: ABC transporter permease [Acidobacteriota bacterium]|nr:ABC transporter permease [Acidobacteriota bacterium]